MMPVGLFCLLVLASLPARPFQNEPGAQREVLLTTSTSWDGSPLRYPVGKPQLTSVRIRLGESQEIPFHCHPVPTFGYVLSGVLEVQTASGERHRFEQGDAVVEVVNTWHQGKAVGGPVEIIVFHAGVEGVPATLAPKTSDLEREVCQP